MNSTCIFLLCIYFSTTVIHLEHGMFFLFKMGIAVLMMMK